MYIELCNVTLQIPKQPELKSFELRKYDSYGLFGELHSNIEKMKKYQRNILYT